MRELSINCNPQVEFLKLLFAKKERIDGRRWDEIREIRLNYNRKAGVSFASLGKTRVLCSIDYEISPPRKSHKPGLFSYSSCFLKLLNVCLNSKGLDQSHLQLMCFLWPIHL